MWLFALSLQAEAKEGLLKEDAELGSALRLLDYSRAKPC